MVYITGDMHGECFDLMLFIEMYEPTENDTLIICGDFGFIFANDKTENHVLDYLDSICCFNVCFVDGNHENFPAIYSYPEEVWNGGRIHRIRNNIIHLMRGQVFTIEGKTFFTMGGAYSVDRAYRKSWWKEELPNNDEYKEALKNLSVHNMKVDYVVSHTAPRPMSYPIRKVPDIHEAELNNFLDYLYFDLDYKHWYCGHWHEDREINSKFTFLWDNIITID